MTPEQKKEVKKIGKQLQDIFPDMFGNIRFNLAPGRKEVNANITNDEGDGIATEESVKL
jgi:hypothetical protein